MNTDEKEKSTNKQELKYTERPRKGESIHLGGYVSFFLSLHCLVAVVMAIGGAIAVIYILSVIQAVLEFFELCYHYVMSIIHFIISNIWLIGFGILGLIILIIVLWCVIAGSD